MIHVSEVGLTQASDAHILEVALQSQRTIVTLDSDFASLVATAMLDAPSVIHIRRAQMDRVSTRRLLEQLVPSIQEDLRAGCLASVTDAGVRIRRLPVMPP